MTIDTTPINKEQVLNAESQLVTALANSDLELLEKLLHDDLIFVGPDGQTITKAMDMKFYRSGIMNIETITPQIENLNLLGNNAVVTILVQLKGRMSGESFEGKFRYLRVWESDNGKLKVIAGSCVRI